MFRKTWSLERSCNHKFAWNQNNAEQLFICISLLHLPTAYPSFRVHQIHWQGSTRVPFSQKASDINDIIIPLYNIMILPRPSELLKTKNMFQPMWASVVQLWTYQLLNLAKYWDLASEVATPDPQTVANLMFFRAWRSPPNTAHQPTPSVKADGTLGDHTIQALPNSPQACISIRLRSLVNKELCFEKYRMLMNAGMLGFCRKNFMADLQPAAGAVLHYVVPT